MKSIIKNLLSQIAEEYNSGGETVQNTVIDEYGVMYGECNGKLVLVKCTSEVLTEYNVIPGTVVIRRGAFEGKVYLKSIRLPDTVEEIKENAFWYCTHLRRIHMSANLKIIRNDAFLGCRSLNYIELPETLNTITGNPFRQCNIEIHSSSQQIKVDGKLLIDDTKAICQVKQPTTIKVPDYVIGIGHSACEYNYRLEKITLPEGLLAIGNKAFLECHALRYMNMPDTVMAIGDDAFAGCNFWRFTFPKSLECIGKDALWGFALLSVIIPGNLHIITADTLPEETYDNIDDIIISCSPDKSKNNGIRRRFRNLLGDDLYEKVKIINSTR